MICTNIPDLQFRKILEELGYRSNQHSAIADNIEKEYMKEINERVRDSKTILRLQKNEFQKQKNELEKCYNSLNDSLYHYKKSHNDMQSINQSVDVNDVNGIEKLKRLTEMRKRELEKSKQNYALDLEKTNQRETVRNFYKLTELC